MKDNLKQFVLKYLKNNDAKCSIEDVLSALKKEMPQIEQNVEMLSMLDEVLKEYVNSAEAELKKTYMKEAELAAKTKKEEDVEKAHPALYSYYKAKHELALGDYDAARKSIQDSKEIMDKEAEEGNPFIKENFGNIIDALYNQLC